MIFSSLALPPTARAAPGDMVLVSCNSSGEPANSYCFDPSMSQDGRYVAFESYATNMFTGDNNNHSDILRKDLQTGEVLLCSCDAYGNQAGLGSLRPSISSDGRYVAFDTIAGGLWPGDNAIDSDIFRKDLQNGELELVSSGPYGKGGGDSTGPSISSDGCYVAFESMAGFSLPGSTYGIKDIFRKDLISGDIVLCSCDSSGTPANGPSYNVDISEDGRYVAFESEASNMIPGILDTKQIYRKDLQTGELSLCSSSISGTSGNNACMEPSMSSDGRYVTFQSLSDNLVFGDEDGDMDVFRKDLQTGEIILCSCNVMGDEGNYGGSYASISPDGRFVSFRSASTNLIPDEVERGQFFRKDLQTGEVVLSSCDSSGNQQNGDCFGSDISSDGKYITFYGDATNLVAEETSEHQVFRKELPPPEESTVQDYTFYFAEGYTGWGFQEYLCLGNTSQFVISVRCSYVFSEGQSLQRTYEIPPYSRFTANVNSEVGEGREVSIAAASSSKFIAERPMYFDYTGSGRSWTGGHDVVGVNSPSTTWYFAEGYTGAGFDQWICVLNPGDESADLTFSFQTQEEGEKVVEGLCAPARSRRTFKVNDILGGGYQASLKLESTQPVLAERSMYFDYQGTMSWGWKGGHCVFGATALDHYYFFAEGTTRTGFEEWLTLQNPGENAITVDATYQCGDADTTIKVYDIPAGRRSTIFVPDEVGKEQDVSVQLYSSSEFLAERPMYFNYQGSSGWNWTGGHCVIGSITTDSKWILAEGYTGDGFEEWLCLHSPYVGYSPVDVTITYYPESGTPIRKEHTFPSGSRYTVYVNHDAGEGQAVAVEIQSSQAIVAERPMYFNYNGACTGGHIVVGCLPWSIVGWSR